MSKSTTVFITSKLIKQIEEESPQCLFWMLSSINRFLVLNPSISLLEFKRMIDEAAPDSSEIFKNLMNEKKLKTIE